MSSLRTIWRIDGMTKTTAIDHARLAAGMRLHVIHSPLTTITMQIDAQQRSYLELEGCLGCLQSQCRIGCPAALFRRLFESCAPEATLIAVAPPQGLACRPYTRSVFAWPDARAQPIESTLLHPWADARLMVQWRRYGAHICGSALLLARADGPDPAGVLRKRNWHALALPMRLVLRYFQQSMPPALPFGAPWHQDVILLTPASRSEGADQRAELSDTATSSAE